MASVGLQRLRKEYKLLQSKPVENIRGVSRVLLFLRSLLPLMSRSAAPLENNVLEWHYVIEGAKGTPYEGGWYHGKRINQILPLLSSRCLVIPKGVSIQAPLCHDVYPKWAFSREKSPVPQHERFSSGTLESKLVGVDDNPGAAVVHE
jgi:hypothetical protein